MKRLVDFVAALLALMLFALPLLVLAWLIRRKLGSPVLFKQVRPGLYGKPFKMVKFRTMTDERGSDGALLSDAQRLTPLGRFLRSSSLDELPELWNVLRGDLSVVGPRPFLPNETSEIKKIIDNKIDQLFAPQPGITGIWQTSGRSNLSFEKRVLLDLHYTNKCSFMFDLKIIAKTIPMILFSKGAF